MRAMLILIAMCCTAFADEKCMSIEMRSDIRQIMLNALDAALKQHITSTFSVWMKDPHGQPARAATGVRNAVDAYIASRAAVEAWSPKVCP